MKAWQKKLNQLEVVVLVVAILVVVVAAVVVVEVVFLVVLTADSRIKKWNIEGLTGKLDQLEVVVVVVVVIVVFVVVVCLKKRHTWYCPCLCRSLTDFQNFFHWSAFFTVGNKKIIEYPTTLVTP